MARERKEAVKGGSVKGVCPVWTSSLMDVDRENSQLGLRMAGEQGRGDHTEARRKGVKSPRIITIRKADTTRL